MEDVEISWNSVIIKKTIDLQHCVYVKNKLKVPNGQKSG